MTTALWLRVSTDEQSVENQRAALHKLAAARSLTITREYAVTGSAYTGAHRPELERMLEDAHAGEFNTLLIWALDRLSREGPITAFQVVQQLQQAKVQVVSLTEPWADTAGPFAELLTLLMGWLAHQESARLAERIRAGVARRKAEGKAVGRQPGAVDKAPRRKSGYYRRWEVARASKGK